MDFCESRGALLAFMHKLVAGQNEITASNEVNKAAGKPACMPFYLAEAEVISEQTVLDDGITIILRSFKFMPDNVERWHGVTSAAIVPPTERAI